MAVRRFLSVGCLIDVRFQLIFCANRYRTRWRTRSNCSLDAPWIVTPRMLGCGDQGAESYLNARLAINLLYFFSTIYRNKFVFSPSNLYIYIYNLIVKKISIKKKTKVIDIIIDILYNDSVCTCVYAKKIILGFSCSILTFEVIYSRDQD